MEQILIKGMKFQTFDGKQVLFNGINVVCKDKRSGYLFPNLEKSFRSFHEMGFNLIRFGIFWDGVEPQPGVYDMEYLKRIKDAIRLARKYDLYVMVDMHQDLFGHKYADGTPDWATLDEGANHPEGCTMWYDAYLQSEAVIRAADNFWADKEAADGIGLLAHYTRMWEQIVQYLDDSENIIGWEPMNEPFMGSLARNAFGVATMKIKELAPHFDLSCPADVTPEQQALFMGYVTEQLQEFDRTTLMDFYRRIWRAVSRYSRKPLVTGGNIYSSSAVRTGIGRLDSPEAAGGGIQIYAPHGYDSVVDSDRYENFSKENVERLFADKRSSQEELGLPLIVGEWGAFPSRDFTNELIRHMNGILERYLWGSAYWDYHPGMEEDENYSSLCRAYPAETAGELCSYHYDEDKKSLEMTLKAAGRSRVYCPFDPVCVTGLGGEGEYPIDYSVEKVGGTANYVSFNLEQTGVTSIKING